ncbi:carboxypeptidase-like regulatory domain-containing protein [Sphingobacterium sp. T2]|uniref:carboxypeptidase-like regulatory domain-containing protein n=1 Tax=Sphingobacterium sp. T2 TaxID=1590596 RepID=UPI000B28B6A9|nr:carboxypeptidase-like regulatory domain-containing protein [Sphingobacterium sp. T2]
MKNTLRTFSLFLLSILFSLHVVAQNITIRGKVTDKQTKEAIEFATVAVVGTPHATKTDENGNFQLTIPNRNVKVRVSYVGYITQDLNLASSKSLYEVELASDNQIEEVFVKRPKRVKYSNKNNPAVELIRKVIAHRDQNRLSGQEFVEFEQYEKLSLGLSNLSQKFVEKKAFKKYQFLFKKESDTTSTYMLPAYMEEKVSKVYYRSTPKKTKK